METQAIPVQAPFYHKLWPKEVVKATAKSSDNDIIGPSSRYKATHFGQKASNYCARILALENKTQLYFTGYVHKYFFSTIFVENKSFALHENQKAACSASFSYLPFSICNR